MGVLAQAIQHTVPRIVAALFTSTALLCEIAYAQNWQAVREKVRGSIVHIEAVRYNRDGTNRETFSSTGFVASCRGHVITVAHAVPRASENGIAEYRASTMSRHRPKTRVEVVTRDDDLDLAILQFPDVQDWKPLEFVDRSANVPEDARLYTLGFPLTSDLASAEGLLSSHFGIGGRWQTTLPLNYGNSGGPVFDIAGRIVGVAVGGFDQARQITYVTQADYLRALRSLLPTSCTTPQAPIPPTTSPQQVTQAFQFSVTVDHQEQRDVNELYCLPEGFTVSAVTPAISSANGNGTRLISANPVPGRPNCIELKAFVRGNGVDRLGGIVINHKGRGWLSGQLNVQATRN
jgi:hypothetical protein